MKLKNLFSVGTCCVLLASCSSDEPANNANGNGTETQGTSYVNIAINLPTVSSSMSRTDDQSNDQFYDGEASEYQVQKAYLVIFKGGTEAEATVSGVYNIDNLKPWNMEGTIDNVTSTAQTVAKIEEVPADNLWALVVLNDADAGEHFEKGKKFSELTLKPVEMDVMKNTNGFYMTNAPLYDKGGATTLVKLNRNQIKATEAEAKAATAAEIYVERGVAKVTVTVPATASVTIDNKKYVPTIQKWALDVTNKTSYLVRNVSSFSAWKDLQSKMPTAKSGPRFYSEASERIYWAIDPNYDQQVKAEDTETVFNTVAENEINLNADAIGYCLENTFDLANQMQSQTTRVVFKATFAPEGATPETFYTIGASSVIYNKKGMQNLVKAEAIKLFEDKNDGDKYTFADNTSVSATAGKHTIEVGDVAYDGTALTAEEIEALNESIGSINTYLNGECYYVARIQHFGQTYTPWTSTEPTYGLEDDKVIANNNYLGRYGMVRNNWYELAVNDIKTLGSPVVPETPNTPDDEKTYYLSFKVNMHSWAKRVQNITL